MTKQQNKMDSPPFLRQLTDLVRCAALLAAAACLFPLRWRSRQLKIAEERCTVCLDDIFSDDDKSRRRLTGCGHSFHVECIDKWFKWRTTCPLCRRVVAVKDRRSLRERLVVAILGRFFKWMDVYFDSELALVFQSNIEHE